MGHKFSLILSREITDKETSALIEAGCTGAVFGTDTLPTNAEITVTKIDVDTTEAPSLAEAIQAALDAVVTVSELSAASLSVPAQPAQDAPSAEKETKDEAPAETEAKKQPAKKEPAKKAPAKRTRKAPAKEKELAETGTK